MEYMIESIFDSKVKMIFGIICIYTLHTTIDLESSLHIVDIFITYIIIHITSHTHYSILQLFVD